jgi:ketosteroid isomerase-like protein
MFSDIKVKISGATAWATYKYALTGDIKERHIDVKGLGTAVLEERRGRWQIVHTHTSAPRRAPAATPGAVPKK